MYKERTGTAYTPTRQKQVTKYGSPVVWANEAIDTFSVCGTYCDDTCC